MNEGDQLRYGWIAGGKAAVPVPMLASERSDAPGGQFINMRTDGYAEFLDDTDSAECFGSAEVPYGTLSATSGQVVANAIIDVTAIFRIPSDTGTYAFTMLGDTCDVGVSTFVQGAYLSSSSNEQFIIVGGDTVNNNWVDVMINPASANRGQTNVA